jgi:3-mercaptopyruvate sulfurtransferase SseA
LAYQFLYRQGYRNMTVLEGGMPAWQERRYPLQQFSRESTRLEPQKSLPKRFLTALQTAVIVPPSM